MFQYLDIWIKVENVKWKQRLNENKVENENKGENKKICIKMENIWIKVENETWT